MARISGLEKRQAPWHLRWFYGVTRKMFGKDLTPAKIVESDELYHPGSESMSLKSAG